MAASKKPVFKRPENGAASEKPRKDALVGALIVITMRDYEQSFDTKYGKQAMAEFDLVVIDGDHAGYEEEARREFGNLAQQIGDGLQPGDRGVCRYISGEGNQGRRWFGVEWSEDEADYVAAGEALQAS